MNCFMNLICFWFRQILDYMLHEFLMNLLEKNMFGQLDSNQLIIRMVS